MRPLQLCQIRCTYVHGGLLGTWVKYNQNYFHLYLFLGTHLQVRPVDGFSRMMAQTTRTRPRMCLLWDLFTLLPFRGSTPKNNFGVLIGVFKPNARNRKTYHQNYCIDSNQFCTVIKTTALRVWSQHTHHKSKMADSVILEKSKNTHCLRQTQQ